MPLKQLNQGFKEGKSDNLPKVSLETLTAFLASAAFADPELRHVKTFKNLRASYGDNAVGYVQVKQVKKQPTVVIASVTPEHKVRATPYTVTVVINEKSEVITKATCEECAASADICKHAVAFVGWLHRRSEEPSVTATECYWNKATLSKVGTGILFKTMLDMYPTRRPNVTLQNQDEMVKKFLQQVKERPGNSLLKQNLQVKTSYSLFHLFMEFKNSPLTCDASNFITFCSSTMSDDTCKKIASETKDQSDCPLWFRMRQMRITGSKIYEVSRCKTDDGSLVKQVIGLVKIKSTPQMKRGGNLEKSVIQFVRKKAKLPPVYFTGIVLRNEHPIFGASPDGLTGDLVLEVKCPSTPKSFKTYFSKDGQPASKYKAQMCLSMLMCGRNKGLFCVASPEFEKKQEKGDDDAVTIVEVQLDLVFLKRVMKDARNFWIKSIFPKLEENV